MICCGNINFVDSGFLNIRLVTFRTRKITLFEHSTTKAHFFLFLYQNSKKKNKNKNTLQDNMSKKRALSSRKLTTASLKLAKFLKEAPLKYSSELHKGEKNEILEECYNSLWDANGSWMREYFSKDNSHECNSNEEPSMFCSE
jgi:hypothetical protein